MPVLTLSLISSLSPAEITAVLLAQNSAASLVLSPMKINGKIPTGSVVQHLPAEPSSARGKDSSTF